MVERPVATEELFSKISVIPLETNDSSFLVRPVKVIIKDNRYYIVDEGVPAVFSFDEEGHLLHKIGKRDKVPESIVKYTMPLLKKKRKCSVYAISIWLSLCVFSGWKIHKRNRTANEGKLSIDRGAGGKYFVTWTLPASENDNCISVISKESSKNVKEFWHVPPVLTTLNSKPFIIMNIKYIFPILIKMKYMK